MIVLQAIAFALVALGALAVVLTTRPERQIIALAFYGGLLAVLFTVLKAPDVGLSEIAVGTLIVPFILFVTLAKMQDPNA